MQLDISKLLDHAQARFMDWHVSLREQRQKRFDDLRRRDLSFGGRADSAIRICEELLIREVTKRIEIYKSVSDEYRNLEMLSAPQIDKLRERVMTSVRSSISALEGRLQRDRAAAGEPAPLPNPERYVTLEAVILDVVNTKLRVLETEGAIRKGEPSDRATAAKKARACTVAKIIRELDQLRPQMFEDQKEYDSLRVQYPDFLAFLIAERRPDLKTKILAIRASTRHIRLAQEIAAAHHGRQLSTIRDDWKDFKPEEFKRPR